MSEVIWVLFLFFLEFAMPVVLIVGLFFGMRALHKRQRERESLNASRGDEVAMELERKRRKAKWIGYLVAPLWLLTFVALLWMGLPLQVAFGVASLPPILPLYWSRKLLREYNEGFKEHFAVAEFSKVFNNLDYRPQERLSIQEVQSFFTHTDEVKGNDLICAEYEGVRFEQSDLDIAHVWTETVTDDDGDEHEVTRSRTVFAGRAMRFDFTSGISGQVQVRSYDFDGAAAKPSAGGWQEVETELEDFRRHFRVLALDPLDAMAVLTPQMIEGIYGLQSAIEAPLAIIFKGNAMYVFMEMQHDAFEANKKRTLLESRELLKRDVRLVTDFLDTMYFRRQEGIQRARNFAEAESESGVAPKVPLPAKGSWKSWKRKLRYFFGGKRLRYLLLGLYLVFVVYAAFNLPPEIEMTEGGTIPSLVVLGIMAFFTGGALLAGRFFIAAVLVLLLYFMI
ncbi:MAG: DUF3137 domain-containing protein [Fretibacterium sp.]|nr:DUF3137 domain-containing protein [Fretibacterium sp.]